MRESEKAGGGARKFASAGAAFALLGLALFAYFVWRAGPGEIWANVSRIGWGFAGILALGGLRFVVRALAWTLCFEPPHRLRYRDAFTAYLIGDSAGNVRPLGLVGSEPTKVALVRERVPLGAAVSALAVENIFYMISVALFISCGAAALLAAFPLPKALRLSSYGIIAGALVLFALAFYALRRQWRFLSAALDRLASRGVGQGGHARRREKVAAFEDRLYGFYGGRGARPSCR